MTGLDSVKAQFLSSINNSKSDDKPYPHWFLEDVFPKDIALELKDMDWPAPDLGGVSGTREAHNATRSYFDVEAQEEHEVCQLVADTLQSADVVKAIEEKFNTSLSGTYLRIEYGQDTDGFWLQPHTDIGVKLFTMLIYLSDGEGHEELGTDIYADADTHVGSSPFGHNQAMIFVPADNTWHGFEKRPIKGIRKSLIVNYVSDEWRAREQLAFPNQTV